MSFFLLFLQVVVLMLGINTSFRRRPNGRANVFPKSIKVYLAVASVVACLNIYINTRGNSMEEYSLYVLIAVVLSALGDMMIFHIIKDRKGRKKGVFFISVANYIFAFATLCLIDVWYGLIIIIIAIEVVAGIALYAVKKIVLRKVYLWSIVYGEGVILFLICSTVVLIVSGGKYFVPFIGALIMFLGGMLVLLREYINIRFKKMTLLVWISYILTLMIMAYSPLINV